MPNSDNFFKETKRFSLDWFASAHACNRNEAFSLVEDMDYPVIPLCPTTKRPRTAHGYKDATKDLSQVVQWWANEADSMIGIPTGQVSGIVILDIDNKNGKNGSNALAELETHFGKALPKTYAIRTPSGGYHYVFKLKEGQIFKKSIGKLGEGIDFLAEGAYAVAQNSVMADGGVYELICAEEIPYLPDWFVEHLTYLQSTPSESAPVFENGKIAEGKRNQSVFLLCCSMRAKGLQGDDLLRFALWANRELCVPPMSEDEVMRIVASVERYATAYTLDLIGYAERFADRFHNELKCIDGKLWLRWTGKVWEQSATAANECAKLLPKEVLALSKAMPGPDSAEDEVFDMKDELFGHAKKMLNTPLAVLGIAASDPKLARKPEDFDAHPTLINATNGVIDLKTGELLLHDAGYLMTRSLRVDYRPGAQSDLWNDFLTFYTDGNPEIEAYLARMFGGIGLVDGNPDEVMMMLSGPAANGKSTFIGAVSHVMGSYIDILRTEVLMGDAKFSDFRNDIADLKGARLVISSEPPQHCKLNCAFIKGYTGGDELKGRHNYASSIKFKASGLPVLQTNWEPRLPHGDVAMHRRLQLYRHDTVVLAEKRNQNLKEALKHPESAEAVLAWLVRGRLDYLKQGLNPPKLIIDQIQDYIGKKDLFSAFLLEKCVEAPDAKVQADTLWKAYQSFYLSMENQMPSQRDFYDVLGRKYEKRGNKGCSYYYGIGLKNA